MRIVTLTFVAGLLAVGAADARAAWAPTMTSYTGTIGNARTALSAYYGTGAQASTIPARAQHFVQKADRRLAQAVSVLGSNPGWREIERSLKQLRKAVHDLQKAGHKARSVSAFQDLLTNSSTGLLPVLYGLSRTLAVDASTYVNRNFSSRRATRKLLRAGAYATKAIRLSSRDLPNFARAIEKNRKAIRILGRSGLL